jgi:hypothetical protein
VPEVVEDGVTGFIVDDEEQAIRALKNWVCWTDEWSAPGSKSASPQAGEAIRDPISGLGRSRRTILVRDYSAAGFWDRRKSNSCPSVAGQEQVDSGLRAASERAQVCAYSALAHNTCSRERPRKARRGGCREPWFRAAELLSRQ